MKVKIDFTKSAQENADQYYKRAKKLLAKKEGAEKAIGEMEKRLAEIEKSVQKEEHRVIKVREKIWYEKFHWFNTSNRMLVIGGRDAHQNEILNSRHFTDNDLFFHADIFGASVTILKDGLNAGNGIKEEVAQFAGCYSSVWPQMQRSVDVYAMRRNQVSKSTERGSLAAGSFLLKGEREWFRNMQLVLILFVKDEKLHAVPSSTFGKIEPGIKHVKVVQGDQKKSDAAKRIASILAYNDIDSIMQALPAGTFGVQNE